MLGASAYKLRHARTGFMCHVQNPSGFKSGVYGENSLAKFDVGVRCYRLGNTLQGFYRPGHEDTSDPHWEPRTGLRKIVRERQATAPTMTGLSRPRPVVPLGQASYWERYTEVAQKKAQEASEITQAAKALDTEVRAAPEVKLCRALAKQINAIRSMSPDPSGQKPCSGDKTCLLMSLSRLMCNDI